MYSDVAQASGNTVHDDAGNGYASAVGETS